MYSVVLMAALATSSAAPEFGHHRCHGCSGCYCSCYGGYGCHGCYGCYGCSCWGYCYGCHGCHGWCHGCHGCHGCYGGWGYGCSCWGGYGCWGCYGGYGCYGGVVCSGCYGACVGWGDHGPYGAYDVIPGSGAPGTVLPGGTGGEQIAPPMKKDGEKKEEKVEPEKTTRVKVRVDLPADARLFVDGKLMKSTSARRVFQTPPLNPNQAYFYDVRVEVERNGQTVSDTQRLIVRPGRDASISFASLEDRLPAIATASNRE